MNPFNTFFFYCVCSRDDVILIIIIYYQIDKVQKLLSFKLNLSETYALHFSVNQLQTPISNSLADYYCYVIAKTDFCLKQNRKCQKYFTYLIQTYTIIHSRHLFQFSLSVFTRVQPKNVTP